MQRRKMKDDDILIFIAKFVYIYIKIRVGVMCIKIKNLVDIHR